MNNRNLKSSGFCSAAEEPDSSEQIATKTMPEFNVHELLQWLRKREGELEELKERTASTPRRANFGSQAKAYKDVQNYIEQRIK